MTPKSQLTTQNLDVHFANLLKIYQVLNWRSYVGPIIHRIRTKTKNPMAGFPDRSGVTKRGRLWAAEIKGPGDRLSEKQMMWLAQLAANGCLTKVIKSYDDSVDFVSQIVQN